MRHIEFRDVSFNISDPNHEAHWDKVENGEWQPWIFPIYDRLLDKDHCYIDFGSWIGVTSLYAATKSRHCYAFEPDPVAFELLKTNTRCNREIKNITLVNVAIWIETKTVTMGSETDRLGNSDTSIMLSNENATVDVSGVKFAYFRSALFSASDPTLFDIEDCNLIKFDIEGAEFAVINDMLGFLKSKSPSIILYLHRNRIHDQKERIQKLTDSLN